MKLLISSLIFLFTLLSFIILLKPEPVAPNTSFASESPDSANLLDHVSAVNSDDMTEVATESTSQADINGNSANGTVALQASDSGELEHPAKDLVQGWFSYSLEDFSSVQSIQNWLAEFDRFYDIDPMTLGFITHFEDSGSTKLSIEGIDPSLLELLVDFARQNPEDFIEALAQDRFNSFHHLWALSQALSSSDSYLLLPYLDLRHPMLVPVAVDKDLHLQAPENFIALFEELKRRPDRGNETAIFDAVLKIDFDRYLPEVEQFAVNTRTPFAPFWRLREIVPERLNPLAHQMWQKHLSDNYHYPATNKRDEREMRIEIAVQMGVADAIEPYLELVDAGNNSLMPSKYFLTDNLTLNEFRNNLDRAEYDLTRLQWFLN